MSRRNLGNKNFKGKKTFAFMYGKFVEDIFVNFKESVLKKEHIKQMKEGE
jgi:hypothetical protein